METTVSYPLPSAFLTSSSSSARKARERLWKDLLRDPLQQLQEKPASGNHLGTLDVHQNLGNESLVLDGSPNLHSVHVYMHGVEIETQDSAMDGLSELGETGSICNKSLSHRGKFDRTCNLEVTVASLEAGQPPDPSIGDLISVLSRCREEQDEPCALRLLVYLCHRGLDTHIVLGNFLVPLLVEVGCMSDAQKVFNKLEYQNEYSYSCLITGYTKYGEAHQAMAWFQSMQKYGSVKPNGYTYVAALKACSDLNDINRGSEIHDEIISRGLLENDRFIGNTLVDMYAKNGCVAKAHEVFDNIPVRDVVTWNALASGYVQDGSDEEALRCIEQMKIQGISPDSVSYVCIFRVCSNLGDMEKGQEAHAESVTKGITEGDPVFGGALLDMYGKCGWFEEAQDVFDRLAVRDVVSWTALIAGYAEHEQGQAALDAFDEMQAEGISPNAITFTCALKACASVEAIDMGQDIHSQIESKGLLEWHVLLGSTLVVMYAKCGVLSKAQEVFDKLPVRDVVSWTALIAGYTEMGYEEVALANYDQMQSEGVFPDGIMFTCMLKTCGSLGAVEEGRELHSMIEKLGALTNNTLLGNSLLDFYAKCGLLSEAEQAFIEVSARNIVSWTSLVAGYGQCGEIGLAFGAYDKMVAEGVKPNLITFVATINACCHAGLIEDGKAYFEVMIKGYDILPTLELYTNMIDLYCRAGQLYQALGVINEMPWQTDLPVWHIVLGACQKWANVELGQHAFENVVQLHGYDHVAFVCMSNIYADAGMLQQVEVLRRRWYREKCSWSNTDVI